METQLTLVEALIKKNIVLSKSLHFIMSSEGLKCKLRSGEACSTSEMFQIYVGDVKDKILLQEFIIRIHNDDREI